MSENLRLYQSAAYGMNAVVMRVDPSRWDEPSKCSEWTCREVLGHAIWHTRRLASGAGVGEHPSEQPEADVAGTDPVASWTEALNRVMYALDQPGALQRTMSGPFGDMAVDDQLWLSTSDVFTHTWDIAAALGMEPGLDQRIAAFALERFMPAGDALRQPGLLGPEVKLDGEASPIERYLAFAGRDPRSR